MISYAGIGSRRISEEESNYIRTLSKTFSSYDFTLYSGHAEGADLAFESGSSNSVIWLPWDGFNGVVDGISFIVGERDEGISSISKYHPNPSSLGRGARLLMSRNHFQIHGDGPLYPMVSFVVCCSDEINGRVVGGTGQAIRIALDLGIPYFNIRNISSRVKLMDYVSLLFI